MTIKNWFKFFMMCILIGGGTTAIASLAIRWDFYKPFVMNGEIGEFLAAFIWMVVLGITMSVIAQAGYFAYLTLHQVGVGVFKTLTLWNWVQLVLIIVVVIDVIIFLFRPNANTTGEWLFFIGLLIVLIGAAIWTGMQKVKMTGKKHILISSIFFMIVVTSLEWIIALMGQDDNMNTYVALILFPLIAVNAFQLLMLPKYNEQSAKDLKQREQRRNKQKEATP